MHSWTNKELFSNITVQSLKKKKRTELIKKQKKSHMLESHLGR